MNDASALLNLKLNSDIGSGRPAGTRADFSLNLKATGSDAFEASLEKARAQEKQRFDVSKQRAGARAATAVIPGSARAEVPPARVHTPKPEDHQTTVVRASAADRTGPEDRSESAPAAAAEADHPPSATTARGRGDKASENTAAAEEKADNASKVGGEGERLGAAETEAESEAESEAAPVQENIPAVMGLPADQAAQTQTSALGLKNDTDTPFEGGMAGLSAEDAVVNVTANSSEVEMPVSAESALPDSGLVVTEAVAVADQSRSGLSLSGLSLQGNVPGKGGEGLPSAEATAGTGVQAVAGDGDLLKASLKGVAGTEGKGGMSEDALKTVESLTARSTTPANPVAGLASAGGAQAVGAAVGHSSWQSLPGNLLGPGGAFAAMQAQVGSPAFGEELAQKMSLFVSKSLHSAQLVLNPAELGPIEIKLQLHKDQAQIQVQTTVPLVRDLVEGSAQRLREMLAEQGINLARFDVGSRQSDRGDAQNGQQQDGERGNASGFGADEPERTGKAQVLGLISERLVDYYA